MDLWKAMQDRGMEQLVFCQDQKSGLKAVIALHSTKLGPALGGCRLWSYASEQEAAQDAMKLARGMTYKAAISGLPYGGGKAVVMEHAGMRRDEAFAALGRFIERLHGEYITGVDLGTTPHDMDQIHRETRHVTDQSGTLGATGNFTAEMTAYGVFLGIQTSLTHKYGLSDMNGVRVALQGLGKVGYALARRLHQAGAQLIVSDIDSGKMSQAVRDFKALAVSPDDIHLHSCEVYAPCAMGGTLTHLSIPQLSCGIIAGAANNQLADEQLCDMLEQRNILYAPDYAINAGGILSTGAELAGTGARGAAAAVEKIPHTLKYLYDYARKNGITTAAAADSIAEAKFA
ncbi:Glu/Leu/Phe/Val dehydrogenase dimerization domain-containing protein [Paenibacillus urinalis]|uniref:Glu/Leu/Phe/Val dehydrogenase dimerization domain-containing protein n=2 Tax=Paenibacillus TaxID=44249 RepID=A0ABY7XBN9_9BACL|nr:MULTISPECIES: Glu/Leu/Phe/Val dehydrogenase dimerization domain-containing protein [Paenibacillus]WDH98571.1 Glu/Leu/Phe/Val dehydrogenase dimerization domain-containing protein [Paenibacillus urinalis]WDI02264.1 Glu/Leu/Phe/Val dehydrogenase dimerization domain-containing protein [Paenibacillus urinalis]SDW89804.1 leucine dehydrogenase [Paenibacillus sp. PDC88]